MTYGAMQLSPMASAAPMTGVPYGALPGDLNPQGFFGNMIGGLAPWAGRQIGLPPAITQTVGGLARLLPFEADPTAALYASGQLAPQGFFGNVLSGIAPWAGRQLGLPAPIGQAASGLARLLPFEVDPTAALYAQGALAPQGLFGGALGGFLGRTAGGALGHVFGARNVGRAAGGALGGVLGGLLPFQADPVSGAYADPYAAAQFGAPAPAAGYYY